MRLYNSNFSMFSLVIWYSWNWFWRFCWSLLKHEHLVPRYEHRHFNLIWAGLWTPGFGLKPTLKTTSGFSPQGSQTMAWPVVMSSCWLNLYIYLNPLNPTPVFIAVHTLTNLIYYFASALCNCSEKKSVFPVTIQVLHTTPQVTVYWKDPLTLCTFVFATYLPFFL